MSERTDTSRSGDLVERLRERTCVVFNSPGVHPDTECLEAADRIEALEAENERLRSTNLTDVELEAACHAVGIFLYGPDAERFEKMFDAAMTARTARRENCRLNASAH